LISRSGLLKTFRSVTSNPDIIIKIHKDVFLIDQETISLTAFDADTNSVIYTEERKLVDEDNDVSRLVAHFLARVESERALRQVELDATLEKERKREQSVGSASADTNNKSMLVVFSPSTELLQMLIEQSKSSPNKYGLTLRGAATAGVSDVVLSEDYRNGTRVLMLTSGDPKDVLHAELVRNGEVLKAIAAMSHWICSRQWE
jgi:hypothetical protein